MQYAFIPEGSECHSWPSRRIDEETKPPLIGCTERRLHVNFKSGDGRRDIGTPYGAGCGGYRGGVSVGDDDCSGDIPLYDAASQVELSENKRRGIALQVSRDGHRVAYLSKKYMRFMSWDLPTAQLKAISPRLDTAQALDEVRDLAISPDGKFFAVSFAGAQPRLLVTEFATGQTITIPGFCSILGMSRGASRIATQKTCTEFDTGSREILLKRDGAVLGEWSAVDFPGYLSPDGRSMLAILPEVSEDGDEYAVIRDAMTGKVTRKLKLDLLSEPSDAIEHAWLTNDEYIIEAETPEPDGSFGYYRFNVKTGASHRIRDLGLNPGESISLGIVFARDH
ncbi:hypothetical protein LDL08_06310 [Nonomuraea glycinis]|uniref:WD40 repeat domain-containing protein n=1 Tax=Nonomuraea glycinis TaxID=2047744 RepID=A0A918E444_9ACTN|nr:hypothetical protein [Nonomuraea glycinis]MCA2175796.1 hypothetical protein [Nonomuraea glycinis]GGP05392.1 hypothetical protein GCM10012278_24740 [Nonomuraea glycinis]